jgi:hypothetical protein
LLAAAVVSLTTIAGCAAPTADEDIEGTGESQDHLLAGRRLSEAEAAGVIRRAGFPESMVGKMLCTIKYESNFYERASNKNHNGTTDYGLLQVNSIHLRDGGGCPSSAADLYTASANTKCALQIYRSQGITAWYGYQKHRSECDGYKAPAASESTPPPQTTGTGNGTTPPPAKPPVSSDPPNGSSPGPDTSAEGGCYSGTLEEMEPANTCVESKFNGGGWFQCHAGKWYGGGDSNSGPYGACAGSFPLP